MKICSVCRAENNDQNAFCEKCGAQFAPVTGDPNYAPGASAPPTTQQPVFPRANYHQPGYPNANPQPAYYQQPNYQPIETQPQLTQKSVRGEDLAVAALTAVVSMYMTFLLPGNLKVWLPFIAAGILSIVALVYTKSRFNSFYMKIAVGALVASILFIPIMLLLS